MKVIVFKDRSTMIVDDSVLNDIFSADDKMVGVADVYGNVDFISPSYIARTRDLETEELHSYYDWKNKDTLRLDTPKPTEPTPEQRLRSKAILSYMRMNLGNAEALKDSKKRDQYVAEYISKQKNRD